MGYVARTAHSDDEASGPVKNFESPRRSTLGHRPTVVRNDFDIGVCPCRKTRTYIFSADERFSSRLFSNTRRSERTRIIRDYVSNLREFNPENRGLKYVPVLYFERNVAMHVGIIKRKRVVKRHDRRAYKFIRRDRRVYLNVIGGK